MAANEGENEAWARRHNLEHPELGEDGQIDWDLFWLHRRKSGVLNPRPHFTGDVFVNVPVIGEEAQADVVILQHPCALMNKDNVLRPTLLIAKLVDYNEVPPQGWLRNYDVMPLVVHDGNPLEHKAAALDEPALVRTSDLSLNRRIACMEIGGIARLLQRWTNVNTRVVVPAWRFVQVIEAQFAEAEGMEAWCAQRQHARVKQPEAMKEATDWLDERSEDTGKPRRELLKDPAYRKHIVRRMHEVAKEWTERDNADKARIKAEVEAQRQAGTSAAVAQEVNPGTTPAPATAAPQEPEKS